MTLRIGGIGWICFAALCAFLVAGVGPAWAALPDGRGYELVSPPQKNNGDVIAYTARTRAAADGNAVQFASLSGFGDVRGGGIAPDYLSVRTGKAGTTGWATHAITPGGLEPQSFADNFTGMDAHYVAEFSPDLARGIFTTAMPLTPTSPNIADMPKLYLRADDMRLPGSGTYRLLTDCTSCTTPFLVDPSSRPVVAGASADFSHVIFESQRSLTAEVPFCDTAVSNCPTQLYEWAGGVVRLAGVLPDGETPPSSVAGQGALRNDHYTTNAISQDGSRIFFTVPGSGLPSAGQLYMRVGNGTPGASTVRISASEQASPDPCESTPSTCPDAQLWAETPDGKKAFFTTSESLGDGVNAGGGLYVYDVDAPAGHHLSRLAMAASVVGVVGVSDDGSYVYFVSSTQLIDGLPDDVGQRIFVWHDGTVHQVGEVSDTDVDNVLSVDGWRLAPKTARVAPDGRHMVFTSKGTDELPHTGAGDACLGGCEEVWVYDATADGGQGRLTCASCHDPVNAPAQTDAGFFSQIGRAAAQKESHLNHPLSDDGRYVFFTTGDQLVPEDKNGTTQDVYEYDTSTGNVHLLSSGKAGSSPAYFMDASTNGHDAFFATRTRLVGWDVDENFDLYDARIGGGVPEPVPAPPECEGDACQGSQHATSSFSTPASITVAGAREVKRHAGRKHKACGRGKVRRKVHHKRKCVKRRRSRRANGAAHLDRKAR